MRLIKTVILLSALLIAFPTAGAQSKKYDIKSGIITFEQTSAVMGMKIKKKIVVSFDDYGIKECKETFSEDEVDEVFLSDGKTLYGFEPAKKIAYKRGDAYRGTEVKFDWNEVSEKDKKEGKAKKLPSRTVAGKACEAFQHVLGTTVSEFAGWKGITLYTDIKSSSAKILTQAVKIEENVAIPASKFQVPAGFTVK